MAIPSSRNARLFYRAAQQRFEDAEFLLSGDRTTGTVYLAGYGVECILKALILSTVPQLQEQAVLAQFRGGRAHDFDWLLRLYRQNQSVAIPRSTREDLRRVTTWSTEMRYSPGTISLRDARGFLDSAANIIAWAEGRIT